MRFLSKSFSGKCSRTSKPTIPASLAAARNPSPGVAAAPSTSSTPPPFNSWSTVSRGRNTAGEHDSVRAPELCAGLRESEIAIFDKAYGHFAHLWTLATRGVFWVTRAKANLKMKVKKRLPKHADPRILRDDLVELQGGQTAKDYPQVIRRVTALVEIDGEERETVFLTNNLEWSAVTVCDLYRCRWQIETFFKQLKQSMQLVDFLGNSANAVKWQVWTALLVHLLLRFLAWRARWAHSFTRLFTYLRAALWLRRDLAKLLRCCGTAPGAGPRLPPLRPE